MLTFMSRTSIFKTLNFISDLKSLMYVLILYIQDGHHFKVHFCLFSLIFRKSLNDFFFDNTIYSYMFVSLLILEIYLLSALFAM